MPCRIRQNDTPEDAPVADAEGLCRMDHVSVNRLERAACQAVHEREAQ